MAAHRPPCPPNPCWPAQTSQHRRRFRLKFGRWPSAASRRVSESCHGRDETLRVGESPRTFQAATEWASRFTFRRSRSAWKMAARLPMLGLPAGESMRCRLLLGLAVSVARCSKPMVALTRSRRLGLPVEEQRGRFVQQRLRKRRIALDPFDYRLLEITSQCHGLHLSLWPLPALRARAFLRILYSANKAFA